MAVYCEECYSYMQITENGIVVPYGCSNEVRRGDRYTCIVCGKTVVGNFGEPYDPEMQKQPPRVIAIARSRIVEVTA